MGCPDGETRRCGIGQKVTAGKVPKAEGGERREEKVMGKILLLAGGVAAWAAVALVAALIVFNIGEKNQVLMFVPILAAVAVAWGIGELVTERVFKRPGEEG